MSVSIIPMDRGRKKSVLTPLKVSGADVFEVMGSPVTTGPSSPTSSEGERKLFSFGSLSHRTRRSFSSAGSLYGNSSPRTLSTHGRRLSKSRPPSSTPFEVLNRRGSGFSDDLAGISLTDTVSTTSSSIIDWRLQNVEGVAPLEVDSQLLKTKTPYLVVTTDYIVTLKTHADVQALFPKFADGSKSEAYAPTPEPLLAIPASAIVSVFIAESTRPSFGIEVWWRAPSGVSFQHTTFFFSLPSDRDEQMQHIVRAMRVSQNDEKNEFARRSLEVTERLRAIHEAEEPKFKHRNLEIFPVVPRGDTRRDLSAMQEESDNAKKAPEGAAFYLVVGAHLCYLVQICRSKAGDLVSQHKTYGLVTLEDFVGDWTRHQERFNITFREPLGAPVTLELASRYYRQIIHVFGTADRFLKPAWPQLWQSLEIFRVSGLKEPQYLVPKEDFGSVKRTLDAYLAAYRCPPVEWEINWRTEFAPEFRLMPSRDGSRYSSRQLLAVLRALRYNDYFNSLSFRDVDLSVLWGVNDKPERKRGNVAYLTRTCSTLMPEMVEVLKTAPVLHQEFHALAFCSGNIRQIDFSNCSASYLSKARRARHHTAPSLQFLSPILELLNHKKTTCNRLILSGNTLLGADIQGLAESLKAGNFEALDVSYCGLDDMGLRDMIFVPLMERPRLLQSLNLSGNPGRLPAQILPQMIQYLGELKELNLKGILRGTIVGPLIPVEILDRLWLLEELDMSNFMLNNATLRDLEEFLRIRAWRMDNNEPSNLNKLVLNACGITGYNAARLFSAIGENHGLDLSLNSNPIEEGVDDLAEAIRLNRTPIALSMDMIEFREERNYLKLMQALTHTQHLMRLSMVGTAATPSTHHGPCSQEMARVLEGFFAGNRSLRYLDLSGFCGKLDDSHLSRGFGRSLVGLTRNSTLTHLRIRNQRLNDDAGAMGLVLRENKSLVVLDCQANGFNLTSLQFLVQSFRDNTTLLEFPLAGSQRERDDVFENTVSGLNRKPANLQGSHHDRSCSVGSVADGSTGGVAKGLRDLLKKPLELARENSGSPNGNSGSRSSSRRASFHSHSRSRTRHSSIGSLAGMGSSTGHHKRHFSSSSASSLQSGVGTLSSSPALTVKDERDPLSVEQEAVLRERIARLFDELEGYVMRNRRLLEELTGQVLSVDYQPAGGSGGGASKATTDGSGFGEASDENKGELEGEQRWPRLELKTIGAALTTTTDENGQEVPSTAGANRNSEAGGAGIKTRLEYFEIAAATGALAGLVATPGSELGADGVTTTLGVTRPPPRRATVRSSSIDRRNSGSPVDPYLGDLSSYAVSQHAHSDTTVVGGAVGGYGTGGWIGSTTSWPSLNNLNGTSSSPSETPPPPLSSSMMLMQSSSLLLQGLDPVTEVLTPPCEQPPRGQQMITTPLPHDSFEDGFRLY